MAEALLDPYSHHDEPDRPGEDVEDHDPRSVLANLGEASMGQDVCKEDHCQEEVALSDARDRSMFVSGVKRDTS